MREILWIALAGALGSVSRYSVSLAARRWGPLPWGTLLVNVSGALLLGALFQLGLSRPEVSKTMRTALATGFLGAFTTFSTLSVETVQLAERGAWGLAAANVGLNLLLGLPAAWAGMWLTRWLLG